MIGRLLAVGTPGGDSGVSRPRADPRFDCRLIIVVLADGHFSQRTESRRRSRPFRAWRAICASPRRRSILPRPIFSWSSIRRMSAATYKLPQAAFWQAPVASDRSRGDMALVGYFVQWVSQFADGRRCRSSVGSLSIPPIFNFESLRTGSTTP